MSDIAQVNFDKLESRILSINDPKIGKYNEMRELIYTISVSRKSTLVMATGGSKVVAYYLQLILERLGFNGGICEVIEPRDYFYKVNKNRFGNLVVISASGKSNGVKEALEDFKGNKYLISSKKIDGNFEVITWGNELYDKEHSFISLASSLGPITLMLDATTSLNYELIDREIENINIKIKELLVKSRELISRLPISFKDTKLLHILCGYEVKCSSSTLESNLSETGYCIPVIHDKGAFCHGRSNLIFRNPDSKVVYLSHEKQDLDEVLERVISSCYDNLLSFDSSDISDNYFWREYFLLLQMYYLSKKIAEDKDLDLTNPLYDRRMVKELYSYRGKM